MGFWPTHLNCIDHKFSICSLSLLSLGGSNIDVLTSSVLWPSANAAVFVPFRIPRPITIKQLFVLNGTTVAGSFDIGVYSVDGTRLVSTGSTLQTATSQVQTVSVTPTQIGPGLFYLALNSNSTLSRYLCQGFANASFLKMCGLARQAAAFPLPATATLSTSGLSNLPIFGLSTRSFL